MNASRGCFSLGLLFLPCLAWADGGTLRLSEQSGPFRVSVFTDPAPFRAGPVDVSVLVQDANTGQAIMDANVTVATAPADDASAHTLHLATQDAATNKLFYSARFDLPESGRWLLNIQVDSRRGPAHVRVDVEAAEPLPRWREMWLWILWPAIPIAVFAFRLIKLARR